MKRTGITTAGLIIAWWSITRFTSIPAFLLPSPQAVAMALWTQRVYLTQNTLVTCGEIVLGLMAGTVFGSVTALGIAASTTLQRWLMPILLLSQAIPAFTLAPILVLWLGFGIASKVALAMLVIFFPITANFLDGLRRANPGWSDLAKTMNAHPLRLLLLLRLPAALPSFASGMRIAAATAPIGAVLGEWAGASSGLGYVMINANARIETDLMFAALVILAVLAIGLYVTVDRILRRLLFWAPDG